MACRPAAGDFLVLWEHYYQGTYHGIAGVLVDSASRSYGSFDIRVATPVENRDYTRPAVATGAGRILAIWEADRDDLSFQDIEGRWIQLDLFSDGFESGGRGAWSASTP